LSGAAAEFLQFFGSNGAVYRDASCLGVETGTKVKVDHVRIG
jgi:hypothetical protein